MNLLTNPIYQSDIQNASELPISWSLLSGKTILFTGATGMIASVMIDILMYRNQKLTDKEQGVHIIAVSRNEEKARQRFDVYWDSEYFTYLSHDITSPLPELGTIQYILHAASNTHPRAYASDPIGTITANVQGTYQLLEYASVHNCSAFSSFHRWKSMVKIKMMWISLMKNIWDILIVIQHAPDIQRVSVLASRCAMRMQRKKGRIL